MARLMSVAMTTDAVIERRKTVTRRKGWWLDKNGRRLLNEGDRLTLCRKVQGRGRAVWAGTERVMVYEPIERLAEVEVVDIRRERLSDMTQDEVAREGFPDMDRVQFINRFFVEAQHIFGDDEVTRIEWRYLDDEVTA